MQVLFTPATRIDRVEKAWASGAAEVVVADLEDATPPAEKADARAAVSSLLVSQTDAPCHRAVRINPWPSVVGEDDLDAITHAGPDIIVVPKAEKVDVVQALAARLEEADCRAGLLLILETAAGVLAAKELAASSDRVVAIAFGAEDLAADAGLRRSASNWEVAVPRANVALAAAAAGVAAIDMITSDFQDTERFTREAKEARALGYAGKMCIHPSQVAAARDAFAPTEDEVAWARKVVEAAAESGTGAGGVVVVEGKMIDVPLIQQARRILDQS